MATHVMMRYRIRVQRDTPESGNFEWAAVDATGAVTESGTSALFQPRPGSECALIIASDLVLLEALDVPAAQQRRLSGALQFLVEDRTISEPERLHVVASSGVRRNQLCVAVVDRQWLQAVVERLSRAGLAPRSAVPEILLPQLEPRGWTVVWRGSEGFARTGELSGFALDGSPDGKAPAALRLAAAQARPESIVVRAADGTNLPDLRRWSAELGMTLGPGAPWRWSQAAPRVPLNLLQGEFAPRAPGDGWRTGLRRPAFLAAALLVVVSCGIAVEWATKARERRALLAEMGALYRESFGQTAVVVDAPLQMRRALAELRTRSGEPGASDFVTLVGKLAGRVPDTLRSESMRYEQGVLTVVLRAGERDSMPRAIEELRARSVLPGYEAHAEAVEGGRKLRLTLRAKTDRWAPAKP